MCLTQDAYVAVLQPVGFKITRAVKSDHPTSPKGRGRLGSPRHGGVKVSV